MILWIPEVERIARVIVKNARGHFFLELGQSLSGPPSQVKIVPLTLMSNRQRTQFENPDGEYYAVLPELGTRLMQRMFTGECGPGGWIVVQEGVYRYAVSEPPSVRIVLGEYLAAEVMWDEWVAA